MWVVLEGLLASDELSSYPWGWYELSEPLQIYPTIHQETSAPTVDCDSAAEQGQREPEVGVVEGSAAEQGQHEPEEGVADELVDK